MLFSTPFIGFSVTFALLYIFAIKTDQTTQINRLWKAFDEGVHVVRADKNVISGNDHPAPRLASHRGCPPQIGALLHVPFDGQVRRGGDIVSMRCPAPHGPVAGKRRVLRCNILRLLRGWLRGWLRLECLSLLIPHDDLSRCGNGGFGGQSFIHECLPKIQQADAWRRERKLNYHLEVDGGITNQTAAECARAGADTFVAGTSLFGARSLKTAVKKMRKIVHANDPALADLIV